MKLFFGNALWHLLMQSDTITKGIMVGLLILSIVCWTIIFYKKIQCTKKTQELHDLYAKLEKIRNAQDFQRSVGSLEGLFGSEVILDYVHQLEDLMQRKKIIDADDKELLDETRYSLIEDIMFYESSYMIILFVAAAASPLIGLFGTVWGLMNAFINIGQKQTADIVTVAPGIAEALLTTLGGLIVAIPTLVAYHYLNTQLKTLEHKLFQLSDLTVRIAKSYVVTKG